MKLTPAFFSFLISVLSPLFASLFLVMPSAVFAKSNLNISIPKEVLRTKAELLTPFTSDIQFGNKKAKVQVIVFDSYSCHHCADLYNDTFPELEKRYIKTGKILFIHKDFPLDKLAFFGSKTVHCSKNPQATMHEIYSKQSKFLNDDYEKKFLALSGVDAACVKNFNDKDFTRTSYEYSKVLGISSTPTVYINGEKMEKKSLRNLIEKIESELAK